MKKKLERRDFMKNTTAIAASAVVAVAAGGSLQRAAEAACGLPEKWDHQADVVVVGYGGAGAAAALAANDNRAKVLVLEKAPFAGGNSAVCSGVIILPVETEEAVNYYRALTQGTVSDEELIRAFVLALKGFPERMQKLGLDVRASGSATFAATVGLGKNQRFASHPGGSGEAMFKFLHEQVTNRKIQVMYESSAKTLIQDPVTKRILGVKAESKGKAITIKANRGVIMSCGGYENNPEMKAWYNYPGVKTFPAGTPYNQGDGIRMVSEIGAPLWHVTGLELDGFCHRKPSDEFSVAFDAVTIIQAGFVYVNRSGNRFMPEGISIGHRKSGVAALEMDYEKREYLNMPAFMVFDETCRLKGSIWAGRSVQGKLVKTYAAVHNLYEWSKDNSAEIDKGWILKGETIPDLAAKAGIDAAGLQNTISRYNEFCSAKKDADFNRAANRLFPISTPPYYCSEMALSIFSTAAGPVHNAKAEVLNQDKKPIPGLFAAGEFGCFISYLYQPGNNLVEAITFGFIAGEQAAAQKPQA
jgi:succinate dehydrogenase/fumarate reductase flavoprotein subunit